MAIVRSTALFDLPARPHMLVTLSRAVEAEGTTIGTLVAIIEQDPGLAAAIVKLSNSAVYAQGGEQLLSVRQAVERLGMRDLLALATDAFLRRAFPSGTEEVAALWGRSGSFAERCALLATETRAAARDVAYTLGLFRYIGCAVLLMQAPGYRKTFEALDSPDFAQRERERHGITHAQVGASLVVRWGLSKSLTEAVGAASELHLLNHLPTSAEAKTLLAVAAVAQSELYPQSVPDAPALIEAGKRILATE